MSVPAEAAPAVIPATTNDVPQDFERIAAAALALGDESVGEPTPKVVGGADDDETEEPAAAVAGADDDEPAAAPAPKSSEKYRAKVLEARRSREEKAQRQRSSQQAQARENALQTKEREIQDALTLLKTDPVAYFEATGQNPAEVYQRMTQQAIKPGETKVETQLAKMQALLEQERTERQQELRELQERSNRERWETAHAAAKQRFATVSSDETKYPHLSKISEEDRVEYGIQVASDLGNNKVPYSEADVAEILEEHFAGLHAALTGTKSTSKGGDDTEASRGTPAKGTKKPSRTITSDLASQKSSSPQRDISEESRIKAATEAAQAWANASSS